MIHTRLDRKTVARGLTFWGQWSVAMAFVVALLMALVYTKFGSVDFHYRILAVLTLLVSVPAYSATHVYYKRHSLFNGCVRLFLGWMLTLACLCTIGFALSRQLWLSMALLVAYGMCDGVSVVLRSTIMQLVTPDGMRGRVASINGIFIGSSNELGAFYAGSMARLLGLVPAVVLGGFVTLGVVGVTALKAPRLRRLDLRNL